MAITSLLIIGNGFDLQCGLKSSYADFFEWLKKNSAKTRNNLWVLHFLNNPISEQGWIDIEHSILQALDTKKRGGSKIDKWKKEFKEMVVSLHGFSIKSPESYYMVETARGNGGVNFPFTLQWFLDELIIFECFFSEYLKTEVSSNVNYFQNADKLTRMITDEKETEIISFNYTNPFVAGYSEYGVIKLSDIVTRVTNVHGTYFNADIIFGVDTTEELPIDAHIFTKTHRKMFQSNNSSALPWYVTKVKFYGHSLGKADYSYFQSIFDNYNLYGGDLAFGQPRKEQVVLQFYFTVYDESKREDIIRKATDSVHRLITAYGNTIDNKDKGKNLLHKLLLEGRVQIKFLDTI